MVSPPHPAGPSTEASAGEADDCVQGWAERYIATQQLDYKLAPPPVPDRWADACEPRRPLAPGRPLELRVLSTAQRMPKPAALHEPEQRAKLIHTFLHHELQAAELMCFAILAFPDTPREFQRGLLGIAQDEIRHMAMYRVRLEALGYRVGSFGVRDWIWERGSECRTPVQFVAYLGMGLEAANLDHSGRFARLFADVGDAETARVTERIGREEVAHVSFAVRWFKHWQGELSFESWSRQLPPPLSPLLMRGQAINGNLREKAGLPEAFIEALRRWTP